MLYTFFAWKLTEIIRRNFFMIAPASENRAKKAELRRSKIDKQR